MELSGLLFFILGICLGVVIGIALMKGATPRLSMLDVMNAICEAKAQINKEILKTREHRE